MSHHKIFLAFLCALCFLPLEAAYACSQPMPNVTITCGRYGARHIMATRDTDTYTINATSIANSVTQGCNADATTATLIPALVNDYWASDVGDSIREIEIALYAPERVTAMWVHNLNLLACETYYYETVEGVLLSYKYVPHYCGTEWLAVPLCSFPSHIELIPFINFLSTDFTPVKVAYLGILALGGAGLIQLRQKGQLKKVFMPNAATVWLFLLMCPLLFAISLNAGVWLDVGTVGWVVMVWSIVSVFAAFLRGVGRFLRRTRPF